MKELKLTFSWDGKTVKKEVSGFDGTGCVNATDFIEKGLGTVTNIDFKNDYYIPEPVGLDQHNEIHI